MSAKFDTLKFAESLESSGLSADLTRKLAFLLHDDVLEGMATRQDLKDLEHAGKTEFNWLGQTMNARFAEADKRQAELELRLTVRMGVMLTAAVGIVVAAQQLL